MNTTAPLLSVNDLRTYFHTDEGTVKAVDGISFKIKPGHTLGLVGESGSGKSVTSLSIMRLLPEAASEITGGSISYLGQDLVRLPQSDMARLRGDDISMIFQEPGTSLNPVYRAGAQVMEAILLHQRVTRKEARDRTIELFREVGIPNPESRVDSFPFEMSGGQKQRVMIAMALACNPKLLIADEPTTALDVTIQKQILDLLRELRDQRGMSMLFITHDLGVIGEIADEVAVMFRGRIVEYDTVDRIFSNPQHPYTKGLLACRPSLDSKRRRLPTVSDFMDATLSADGGYTIVEKPIPAEKLKGFESQGRGRLLHPRPELERLGHPFEEEAASQSDARSVADGTKPLLAVEDLHVWYPIKSGFFRTVTGHNRAVDGVSFNVYRGQTLGLVGESGCGKTTTGRAIMRLTRITNGRVLFDGVDVLGLSGEPLKTWRSKLQIIFQDPYASLNPRMTVETMLIEPMTVHNLGSTRQDRRDRAAALLKEVGLETSHLRRYPHEFSGGQRQRLSIARALAVEPEFIICDESVSALDVSVQAQVLNLLKDLQAERGLTYIFISHDLSVVKFMSDMMAVMNAGKIVEFGPSEAIYANPKEEYTQRLIAAIPDASLESIRERIGRRETARQQREVGSGTP
ncbi:MAG: ABC transporter ATP-binding protein [Planctomycetaceae bacterium]